MEAEAMKGRAYLVTGATSGIGRACAVALARSGAYIVAGGRRRQRLEDLTRTVGPANIVGVEGDVREPETGATWVRTAVERFGGLDGLVNAAGVIGSGGLLETEPAEWDRVMETNLRALYLVTRAAAPELERRKGSVVSISSVAGLRPYPGLMAYCVSKAGVDMFTRCAALDLAPRGVRVNAVNPGVVVTELHTASAAVPDYPAFLERSKSTHPLGRVGSAEEVARLVMFLLSDDAGWITGATYSIDGGRALAGAR